MNSEKRTKCERFSRIVGYMRAISQWNKAKVEEFHDRKLYKIKGVDDKMEEKDKEREGIKKEIEKGGVDDDKRKD